MKLRRILSLIGLLAVATWSVAAHGQQYPSRTVTFVVPYQAGGSTDILARVIAQKLTDRWHQRVIVENRPGGNGSIGINQVARADADGTVLLAIASSRLVLSGATTRKQIDFEHDFAPITRIGFVPNVVVVHPSVPAKTIAELIALAKSKPGGLTYGSQSIGSNGHLTGELFQQRAGIKLLHIPYKGSAPAVRDLLGGQINLMFDNLPTVLAPIQDGKLRALAVTTIERSDSLPDVPTVAESGLPGFDTSAWFAVLVAKKTPEPVRAEIESAIVSVLALPDVRSLLKNAGIIVASEGSADLLRRVKDESAIWNDLLTKADIKLE